MYTVHVFTTCIYCPHTQQKLIENLIQMEDSLFAIFDEIWPKTIYYIIGTSAQFLSNLRINFVKKIQLQSESFQTFYTTQEHVYVTEKVIKR